MLSLEHAIITVDAVAKPEFKVSLGPPAADTVLRFLADTVEDRDRWVRALQLAREGHSRSARPSMPHTPSLARTLSTDFP